MYFGRPAETDQLASVAWPVSEMALPMGFVAFRVGSKRRSTRGKALKIWPARIYPATWCRKRIYALDALPLNVKRKVDRRGLVSLLRGAQT